MLEHQSGGYGNSPSERHGALVWMVETGEMERRRSISATCRQWMGLVDDDEREDDSVRARQRAEQLRPRPRFGHFY